MQRRINLAVASALAFTVLSAGVALADHPPRPAHIHTGACPAPGDVVAPLTDVAPAAGDAQGSAAAVSVESSSTTVELALSDIVAADHAFVVHVSPDEMATYVVCGDIGGATMDTDMGTGLAVGLVPVGDSSWSGLGLLSDNGDGTTDVDLFIAETGAMMAE